MKAGMIRSEHGESRKT
ncbi:hypothetical prophage protein [Citrobacter rodentium ICC168]|uniref:Hypothetical prophage protein n=1 Tax=Citrobacter rodentium (strain ICC168) TaxID=637910 RepID=D2TUU7_CITRI|nr:hypothetical prophage protein [Citrobacter rodentium ICC168]